MFIVLTFSIIYFLNKEIRDCACIGLEEDLHKPLRDRVLKEPSIIKRDTTIPISRFTFNNTCFKNIDGDELKLNSIGFSFSDKERIVVAFDNGDLDIVIQEKINKYSGESYIVYLENSVIRVYDYYNEKLIFKGEYCV